MFALTPNTELSYAVRGRVVAKYLGQLCAVSAMLTGVPAVFAAGCGEWTTAAAYLAAALLLGSFSVAGWLVAAPQRIQRNEAIVVAALIFPLTAFVSAGPFVASGLTLEDAVFESISGITTTGLTTLPSVEDRPRSFLFARAWLQWYGGLGIVALSLALASHPTALSRRLGVAEVSDEDLLGGTRIHARRVLVVYSTLTVTACIVLWALKLPWFDALTHSLAAVSTGGFSSRDASLAAFPSFGPRLAVILTCCSCSVSLPCYWRVRREGWSVLLGELQLWALLGAATFSAVLLILLAMRTRPSFVVTAENAALMALSAQTTSGFSAISVAELDAASKLVLIGSMAIGGGTGSTAGGFKILRLLIFLRVLQAFLLRTTLTKHAVFDPYLGDRRLDDATIQPALLIVLLFMAAAAVSWLPFLAYGYDPINSLFEVVSALGTVGLSTGLSEHALPGPLKAVLSFDMLLGRLEFIALMVVFFPQTWFGKRLAIP